jgi:SAM-dependent methyltransferase
MVCMVPNASNELENDGGEWFRRAFDRLYPLIYRHRDHASAAAEVAGLLTALRPLGLPANAITLDIACGGGRHLAAMRRAGLRAFGIDLSEALLERAAAESELVGCVVRADVRHLPFADSFDLATNLFTSFGYFDTDEANLDALRQMIGVLRPGGWLVVDHANRARLEATLVPHDVQELDGLRVESRRAIEGSRVVKAMTITMADQPAERIIESVRVFTPDELSEMFEAAGASVVRTIGSFAGERFADQSERMIVVGKRR